jgi:LacI family transcriptional regulator
MKNRVTQTDIGRAAGVHTTTVSLALRNSPLIPVATRERIQALAAQMGYCPDPALRALVAYRNAHRQKRQGITLAYVTNWTTRWGWKELVFQEKCHTGAKKRAAEHGYNLEHFWLGEAGMSMVRLNQMLLHRGIRGVVLAALDRGDQLPGMDWSRLSAVKIGSFPQAAALHQVTLDYAGIASLAVQRILQTGRRRIGFVVPAHWDQACGQAWSRTFAAEQAQLPSRERLPILRLPPVNPAAASSALPPEHTQRLARWYDQNEPEAMVSFTPLVLEHLARLRIAAPRDFAYVDLALGDHATTAGIRQNCERIGELAVEQLATQVEQNVSGLPDVPTITAVTGTWVAGGTLPTERELERVPAAGAGHLVG